MKKFYTLFILFILGALSFTNAQAPLFFSEYIEGSSNNKALEIFNPSDAVVDLASYQIAQSSNGGGWEYYHTFPAGASIQPGGVWVILNNGTSADLFAEADADEFLAYPSVVHHNGDDARAIVYITDTDTTFLDIIGIPDEDPGSAWDVAGVTTATANHTLVRKNYIDAGNTDWSAAAATDSISSEWYVYDQNFFDSLGTHTYIPWVDVATINLSGEGDATTIDTDKGSLQILAEVLPADATDSRITWSVSDNVLASVSGDGILTAINDGVVTVTATALDGSGITGTIDITLSNQTPVVPVATITVTGTGDATAIDVNSGTLQMLADVQPGDASDASITWSVDNKDVATINQTGLLSAAGNGTVTVTASANDGFGAAGSLEITVSNQYVEVADLSALRAMSPGSDVVYKVTGEVFLTYQQSYRNKKYVQDAAAGIEIDDNSGAISTSYNLYDGITGLMGTLNSYYGQLQFIPSADPGAASSNGNTVTPATVTTTEILANPDTYQSMLIKLESVVFPEADGSLTFANGDSYDLGDANDTIFCKVHFYGTDLTGTVVPDSANVTGILVYDYNNPRISPREAADVEELVIYVPSDDASISDLLVDGVSVDGFTPAQLSYYVVLPVTTAAVPPVTVVTNNDSAEVTVTDALNLDGTEAERTTTVLITAEDEVNTKTYTVTFSLAVGIEETGELQAAIYPVPANSTLFINSPYGLDKAQVISLSGSTLKIVELNGLKEATLDVNELSSGMYFLKLSGEGLSGTLRFIKK